MKQALIHHFLFQPHKLNFYVLNSTGQCLSRYQIVAKCGKRERRHFRLKKCVIEKGDVILFKCFLDTCEIKSIIFDVS